MSLIKPGHDLLMQSSPPSLIPAVTAGSSTDALPLKTTASMPKKGRVAEPGFVGQAPGRGVIAIPPVSVCHHVSTMGHLSLPITLWYHIQALGLIGSPTDPRSLSDERSLPSGHLSPSRMTALIAVGAGVNILTLNFSPIL